MPSAYLDIAIFGLIFGFTFTVGCALCRWVGSLMGGK